MSKTALPNTVQPQAVAADLFDDDDQGLPGLVGGYCAACQGYLYPRPEYCPTCLQPAQRRMLGGRGSIYSYTVIRTRAPYRLPEPYAVGYIDLKASGLRVFGLFHPQATERLQIGMPVALSVMPLGVDNDGRPCLRPVFSPLAADPAQADERSA